MHSGWKFLGTLLLLYAGCRWSLHQRGERPLWACDGHPEALDGRDFWLMAETLTAVDPATGTLEVEPSDYRLRLQAPEGTWPRDAAVGRRLYAHFRFSKTAGFVLQPGARTGPPQPFAHMDLYLVSVPALAFAILLFLRSFRWGPGGFDA